MYWEDLIHLVRFGSMGTSASPCRTEAAARANGETHRFPFLSKRILLVVGFGGHALQALENAGIVIFVQKTDLFADLGNAHPGKTQERDGPAGPH